MKGNRCPLSSGVIPTLGLEAMTNQDDRRHNPIRAQADDYVTAAQLVYCSIVNLRKHADT
ncbi:hypothetical protein J6590_068411 [Homalodisca vitripennis]|nr:hypothetical protein J6590_068411 [Homalodisca vitripennis]